MSDNYKEFRLEGQTNQILSDEVYNALQNLMDKIPKEERIYQEGPLNKDEYSLKLVISSEYKHFKKINKTFISILSDNSDKTDLSYSAADLTPTDCETIYQGLRLGKTSRSTTKTKADNNIKLTIDPSQSTKMEILENYIATGYTGWITSNDLHDSIEKNPDMEYIKLSTISTYLSRMYRKRILERDGNRTQRTYRYIHQ